MEDGGVEVFDAEGVFDGDEGALVGGPAVLEPFLTPPPNMRTLVPPVKWPCWP